MDEKYPHIEFFPDGTPHIDGSRLKVKFIAELHGSGRMSVEQIQESYPHITLAQIHAALVYYYDHKEQVDAIIVADRAMAEKYEAEFRASPNAGKLRALLESRRSGSTR